MATHPFTHLSPADAAVAARSFARRFRDAAAAAATSLDDEPDEADLDEVAGRAGNDGRSALDHLASAAVRLELATDRTRAALVDRNHQVDPALLSTDAGDAPSHSGSLAAELDRLERAGSGLAQVIDDADASHWNAVRATVGGGSATPLDGVQATVAFVLDRLKDTERTLREVRGRTG
jgi:hypothetical protein